MEDKKVVSKVTKDRRGQRRVTIPKGDKTLKKGDFVEVRKIKL